MPEQALANTTDEFDESTMMENTSESSIMPLLICSQLAPPSAVFHARCQVPAYTTFGSLGSTAMDSMFLISELVEEIFPQLLPASVLRNTPSSVPTVSTLESEAAIDMARIDLPCMAGMLSQVLPLLGE